VAEGSRDLDKLVHVATSVYYNRNLEKEGRTWKRKRERINGRRF
jgi:hypothetical protein